MKKNILVIDDDKLILKTIRRLLEKKGYAVVCASDPDEAEDLASKTNFDLLISDIRMPGKDGISLIRKIKEEHFKQGNPDPPFIFITGYANENTPTEAERLGANGYILKPFDLEIFLSTIEKAINASS